MSRVNALQVSGVSQQRTDDSWPGIYILSAIAGKTMGLPEAGKNRTAEPSTLTPETRHLKSIKIMCRAVVNRVTDQSNLCRTKHGHTQTSWRRRKRLHSRDFREM
jgi:hypothetical protein